MQNTNTVTAGIDTSKKTLDMAVLGQTSHLRVPNAPEGWAQIEAAVTSAGASRVGIEATGGYERGVVAYLRAKNIIVDVLQPKQVKAFAMLHLKRAKTDRIDAALIAAATQLLADQSRMASEPRLEAFGDRLTFIEQIEEDIVRYKTRLEHIADKRLRRSVEGSIKREQMRRLVEIKRLLAELRAHADLAKRLSLVLSVPGIGDRTALSIVVRMPELGQVSREEAAALAGLAPFAQQSGQFQGQMHIGGGRERLRRALFAAALPSAYHWNPALMALRTRLTGRGKCHTLTMVACARKLLTYANAVVARGTPWEDEKPA